MASTDKKYRPGPRNPAYAVDGRMTENRLAWIRTHVGQFVAMYYPEGTSEEDSEKTGPTVRLLIPSASGVGRPRGFNLTSLTTEELAYMREFFNMMFDLAQPVVELRDKVAQDAFEQGDDSFSRSYRQVPQFVIRTGSVGPDGESLQHRFAGVAERLSSDRDSAENLRDSGDGVAAGEQDDSGTQDDAAEGDES